MKNNFTQALKELTGFDDELETSRGEVEAHQNTKMHDEYFKDEQINEVETASIINLDRIKAFQADDDNCTHLTSTMVIKGNFKSSDDLYIDGSVYGDIKTDATIHAKGLVGGNITAASTFLTGEAKVKGNFALKEDFVVGENVAIIGDVKCKNAHISGKIKGNCDIEDSATLTSTALLAGDIIVSEISTAQGARIVGAVTTRAPQNFDFDAEFDFGGDF